MATVTKTAKRSAQSIPLVEWVAAGIGAILVLGSIAILLVNETASRNAPPRLSVRVASVEASGRQFLVMLEVHNEGGSTAADARVEAVLQQGGTILERGETTLEFVPAKSRRRAGLFFEHDPKAGDLNLRALSFREP